MNEQKAAHLRTMFGDELANQVIANAESKTKELEQSGTRYKEAQVAEYDEKEFGEITDVETMEEKKDISDPLVHVHGNVKHTHRVEWGAEHVHQNLPAFKAMKPKEDEEDDEEGKKKPPFMKKEEGAGEKSEQLAELLASLVEDIGYVKNTVQQLEGEVKSLKASDGEKMDKMMSPRYSPNGAKRPSEREDNLVGSKELEDVLAQSQGETEIEKNPAYAYVQDLLGGSVRA